MGASIPKDFRKGTPSSQFKARLRTGFIKWTGKPATARDAAESMEFLAWLARDGKLDARPLRCVSAAFFGLFLLEYMGSSSPKISKLSVWSGSHPRGVRVQLAFLCEQLPLFREHRILIHCANQGWKCFSTPSEIGLNLGLRSKSASKLRKEIKKAFNMELTWSECSLMTQDDEKATPIPTTQFSPAWGAIYSINRAQRTPKIPRSAMAKRTFSHPEKPPLNRAKESASEVNIIRNSSPSSTPSTTPTHIPAPPIASLLDSRVSRSSDSVYSEVDASINSASSETQASSSNASSISTSSKANFRVLVLDPPIDLDFLPDELFHAFAIFDESEFHHLDYIGSQTSPDDPIYYSLDERQSVGRKGAELEETVEVPS